MTIEKIKERIAQLETQRRHAIDEIRGFQIAVHQVDGCLTMLRHDLGELMRAEDEAKGESTNKAG